MKRTNSIGWLEVWATLLLARWLSTIAQAAQHTVYRGTLEGAGEVIVELSALP
jgi:hypothetical protein